jgi:Golgi SNAP receptor complex protein 1
MAETMRLGNNWEELRRQARQIENEIDAKLLSLSKRGAHELGPRDVEEEKEDAVPLLGASNDDMFERITEDMEQLLARLSDINNKMSQYSEQLQQNPSAIYTLQRHRDILNDYTKEFRKAKTDISAQREREQLLRTTNKEDSQGFTGPNKRTEIYMKEQEHIRNSESLVDEQINVAIRTRESMMNQRNALKAIQTQMTTLANRFPMINSLIHRINIKRRKDSIIIGSVIGVCLFLLILYKF